MLGSLGSWSAAELPALNPFDNAAVDAASFGRGRLRAGSRGCMRALSCDTTRCLQGPAPVHDAALHAAIAVKKRDLQRLACWPHDQNLTREMQNGDQVMGEPIKMGTDYSPVLLRVFTKSARTKSQSRRLLSLARCWMAWIVLRLRASGRASLFCEAGYPGCKGFSN